MNSRSCRLFSVGAGILAIMVSIALAGPVLAQTKQKVMPASRLAELKNVKWEALSSNRKAVPEVKPTLTTSMAKVKLTMPGYEAAPVREAGVNFTRIDVPGAGITPVVGKPELPVIRRLVAVPEGAKVSFKVKKGTAKTVQNVQIYPVQEPPPEQKSSVSKTKLSPISKTKSPVVAKPKFAFNKQFYGINKVYPEELVTVSAPMKLRELTVVQVEIATMQYNGAQKQLNVLPDVEVELSFSKPFTPKAEATKSSSTTRSPTRSKLTESTSALKAKAVALNSGYVLSRAYKVDNLVVRWDLIKDLIAKLKWDYLIITPDEYYDAIQPLVTWKKEKGLGVHVTKLSQIGASPTSAQIKNYIKSAYDDHAVAYVLLVGDTNTMPAYTYSASGSSTVTDYYYALVDGADYLPDVAIGRFSGRSATEITNLVNKTVSYEKTPTGGNWKRRAVCISDTGYFQTTSDYNYNALVAHGFTVDKIYASMGNATAANVTNAINAGRLLVSYRGHGSQTGWSTTGFNNTNVNALTNGTMLPVIISPTCLTGMYDYSSDCYSECWNKTASSTALRGAVAYWGSARISFGGYNDALSKGAFDDMLGGDHIMGNVVNAAKLNMISIYGVGDATCILELHMFNLFGDPNLDINF
ncbi:MAG: hypothetical protein JXR76_26385 [Deltaproteobacteria bacterium]|nr:hypothetical protein [Deltaproteobacteria bacterium]